MNLVVGATGLVGSEVCARLASEGKSVKALVRVACISIASPVAYCSIKPANDSCNGSGAASF